MKNNETPSSQGITIVILDVMIYHEFIIELLN